MARRPRLRSDSERRNTSAALTQPEGLAKGVLQRVLHIAALRLSVHRSRSLASLRTSEEQEIRDTIGHPRDQPWRLLSVYLYPRLQQELHRRERRARQDAERVDMDRQGDLPGAHR